ncbi:ABC transporter permease [Roseivirga sp. UBA1976]|mgnify:CR=1 FL=1|uniref:ABC transporter permease n=1 Tax=Roseivirga sp. UBA1976 TaxID=1947386 RepID=UPI002580FE04|nr:ABC transporter permease [Roseivirga sp. UBA1976]MEC7754318.1 ABC transporter permease [Bacteroidota bacterium]|tara:strand:+ start:7714 stop:10359 length:2646 start_codon:yes stop_codon:yes gene_type:complete
MLKSLGEKIFRLYCHPDFAEDILGDLEEYYEHNLNVKGQAYANRKFLIDVLLLFRVSLLRSNWLTQNIIYTTMVKNNIKVAYRSMMRHKFYSMLNLLGLAVSMAACIFIAMYVKHELSYDKHFPNSERIFRVANYLKFADNEFNLPTAPDPFAKTVQEEFPEVVRAGRTRGNTSMLIRVGDQYFQQPRITWADQEFMDIFRFSLISGDKAHLLDEPNTVVLEESTARKFFGNEDPIGQTIRVDNTTDMKVTGVIADIPENTHFDYDMFISMLNREDARQNFWLSNNFVTYVELQNPDQQAAFDGKMLDFLIKHMGQQVQQFMGADMQEGLDAGAMDIRYYLQPLKDIHLYSSLDFELGETGTIQNVYFFSIIGAFILLIACINFMNMATARAAIRAKEVGVRKVLGSMRHQLIGQFITEAILNVSLAMVFGILLVYAFLPAFNELTEKSMENPIFGTGGLWPYLLLATFVVGLLAGSYPAFILSSFSPVKVLKGQITKGKASKWLRNTLVIVQFAISIFLIVGSLMVYQQLSFLQNKQLGFNKDQILIVHETQLLGEQLNAFKTELERNPMVEGASVSGYIPATDALNDFPFLREEASSPDEAVSTQNWYVDEDYARVFDIELVAGRFFDKDLASDSSAVIVNETALKRFGYTENPIGKRIKTLEGVVNNRSETFTIIGVMKDFHFRNMTTNITPHALFLGKSNSALSIRFAPEAAAEVVDYTQNTWDNFAGGQPFEYSFLDQIFKNQFRSQQRVKTIFMVFAILAITIACLGLFGLAAFVTEQRQKEIGIRKVLGASTFTLLTLLFNNFTWLILLSAALAIPLAWWYMEDWLSAYPFRIAIDPLIFLAGTAGVLIISWLTVGYQSLKAARRNPVDNLRYE